MIRIFMPARTGDDGCRIGGQTAAESLARIVALALTWARRARGE